MPSNLSLRDLLTGARKRELMQLLQDRTSQAMLVAMGGVILLLLLGTQILEWYWVALLAVISLGVGLYRIRGEVPSLYTLAQRIDRKLRLADALSTACFFAENPDQSRDAICRLQQRNAETTAREVDLRAAVPFRRSRFLLPAAGLAMVALGLFAVRYMVTGSLDLQPSLVSVAMDNFFGSKTEQAKNFKKDKQGKYDPQKDANSPDNPSTENEKQPEDLLSGNDAQDPTQGPDNSKNTADAPPDKKESPDDAKKGDEQADGKDSASDQNKQSENQNKQGDNQNSKPGSSQSESMMDKLKDAMQNLMDSMKSNPQDAQNSQNQNQGKQQQKSDPQKGQKSDQQSKADSDSQASADQQNQDGAQQQSDAKSSQKSADRSSQQDAKNGAGSQDGDKLRRQAEELAAMGKITQILGQRSAQITGEVTVEVGNSKQQLKTPWASSQAVHHDVGGEVPRDEVPLIYQEFVRQYFEEIHKPLPQAAKPAPAKAPAQKGSGPSKASPAP